MENQSPDNEELGNQGQKDNKNTIIIILIIGLALAVAGIIFLLFLLFQ